MSFVSLSVRLYFIATLLLSFEVIEGLYMYRKRTFISQYLSTSNSTFEPVSTNGYQHGSLYLNHIQSLPTSPVFSNEIPTIPQKELDTLIHIFNAMGGQYWVDNSGWDILLTNSTSNYNVCMWFGVSCSVDENESHVIELALPQNNLQGKLPQLFNLTHLRKIDLSNDIPYSESWNCITGDLKSICYLKNALHIDLSYNNISSIMPKCLDTLTMVTSLDLSYNFIEGNIIDEVCSLSLLRSLKLNSNWLNGSIPECLDQCQFLQVIDVSSFDTNGGPFGEQSFTGTIPSSVCNLPYLADLNFGFTQGIYGSIPDCLMVNQTSLAVISLEGNALTGHIPESLCSPSLELLLLYQNELTGTIPSCLGDSQHMLWLALSVNSLEGTIPSELCQLNALMDLSLDSNQLVGTIPSCIGNLTNLLWISFAENKLHGIMPASMCNLNKLVYMILYSNHLSGPIDPCFGDSFPDLEIMFLQDLNLGGELPSKWNLTSLNSIFLSNNKDLSGTLPDSIFHQQFEHINPNLNSIVIEGTNIHGSISDSLCMAKQLQIVALSGNVLSGKIPDCICELNHLETLGLSRNGLFGTIPDMIGNITSLSILDLSENKLIGLIPNSLGIISNNLKTTSIDANYLSCDVPSSVRSWKKGPKNAKVNIYSESLFGCSGSIFAQSIQNANGLKSANTEEFESYGCGYAYYVLPIALLVIVALPIKVILIWLFISGKMDLQWCNELSQLRSVRHSSCSLDLIQAVRVMRRLARGSFGIIFASLLMLCWIFEFSNSPYECQYLSRPTLGNKTFDNISLFPFGIGVCVSIGLISSTSLWLLELRKEKHVERSSSVVEDERLAEGGLIHEVLERHDTTHRIFKLAFLGISMAVLSIGPNIAYVLLLLSNSVPYKLKMVGELLITLVKMILSSVLIPFISRLSVNEAVMGSQNISFVRFRLRMITTTLLLALSLVILPICIVMFTHESCLYYDLFPPDQFTTQVDVPVCFQINELTGECVQYTPLTFNSTYTPSFQLDGEACLSSILSVYVPIFISSILLTAVVPAAVELIIVPLAVPLCFRHKSSKLSQLLMYLLNKLTWNVPCVKHNHGLEADTTLDIDYSMQRVVERGFVAIICTILLAVTFGLAAPLVGVSCFIATIIQLVHHIEVMGQLVKLGMSQNPPTYPNLESCCSISHICMSIIVGTILIVWVGWLFLFSWSWQRFIFVAPIIVGAPMLVLLFIFFYTGIIEQLRDKMSWSKTQKTINKSSLLDESSVSLTHSLIKEEEELIFNSPLPIEESASQEE